MTKKDIRIEYHTNKKPSIRVMVYKVVEGIFYIYCDFNERFYSFSQGSQDNEVSIDYYDEDDNIIFTIYLILPEPGYLFVSNYKKSTHISFYSYFKYEELCKTPLLVFNNE